MPSLLHFTSPALGHTTPRSQSDETRSTLSYLWIASSSFLWSPLLSSHLRLLLTHPSLLSVCSLSELLEPDTPATSVPPIAHFPEHQFSSIVLIPVLLHVLSSPLILDSPTAPSLFSQRVDLSSKQSCPQREPRSEGWESRVIVDLLHWESWYWLHWSGHSIPSHTLRSGAVLWGERTCLSQCGLLFLLSFHSLSQMKRCWEQDLAGHHSELSLLWMRHQLMALLQGILSLRPVSDLVREGETSTLASFRLRSFGFKAE